MAHSNDVINQTIDYGYDAAVNLTSVTYAGTNTADLTMTYDALNRLQTLVDGVGTTTFGYATNGRIKSEDGPWADDTVESSYDAAGNLTNRLNNALNQGFAADALNQLTSAARSGTLTVAGTTGVASMNTSVTINGNAASVYADGAFARAGFTVTNGVNSFTAVGTDSLGRSSTNTVTVTLPATVTFTYDAKGNLLGDGQRVFLYDDENQLVTVYVTNAWKAGFVYDGFGRRREKAESVWSGGAWVTNLVVRYIYDGMLVLQERHFNPAVSMQTPVEVVTYTRGLDLSGSLQGAGGIGGLLARTDSKGTAYYQTDGRGNVTALFNASGGVVARYAYDPFGNTLAASGPMAEANVYRFSSKEIHPGSGLYYYGFRFYDPNLQRWLNRDPIGENGGLNLHQFVLNSPLGILDLYGLEPPSGSLWNRWSDFADRAGRSLYGSIAGLDPTGLLPIDPGDPHMAYGKDYGEAVGMCLPSSKAKQAVGAVQKGAAAGKKLLEKMADACSAACSRKKTGPKPGLEGPHNQRIKEVADELEKKGNLIVNGGKRPQRPEAVVPTPGGTKECRRPDILYETPSGERRGVNVGRVRADGSMIPREQDAFNDLERYGKLPMDFVPWFP